MLSPTPEPTPERFTQADTRSDVLGPTRERSGDPPGSKWLYYQGPVRDYLRRLGCPADWLDDLAQEALIQLAETVVPAYDPARGPFRPYLKAALRNLLRDRYRSMRPGIPLPEGLAAPVPAGEDVEDPEASPIPDLGLLLARAREEFERFLQSEPPEYQREAQILEQWVLHDAGQEVIASHFGLKSSRQVRTLLGRAADRFAAWVEAQLHPEDARVLLSPQNSKTGTVRGLFSHLSKRKRLVVLALLERLAGRR